MGVTELVWALAAGAFSLFVGLTAHFAKRDRQTISEELNELSRRLDGLGRSVDGMRKDLHQILIDHERRLTRLETRLQDATVFRGPE